MPNKPTTTAAPANPPDDASKPPQPGRSNRPVRSSKDSRNRIRVRGKRLDQIDQTKLTLAYWLLAKQITADKTESRSLTEPEVRAVMKRLDSVGADAAAEPVNTGSPRDPDEAADLPDEADTEAA